MKTTRRNFIKVAAAATVGGVFSPSFAQTENFNLELDKLLADETLLEAARMNGIERVEAIEARGTVKSRKKDLSRKLSPAAKKLIIAFEVSNEKVYTKKYQGVIKPGGASGCTIAIGYDIGYVTPENLREDWDGYISDETIIRLQAHCGKTGEDAQAALSDLKGIVIPFNVAVQQFDANVVPIYMAATLSGLKNTHKLSDDSLGALVSLVYNRGPSFGKTGDRYRHMRSIRAHMNQERFDDVPQDLEDMAVLWQTPDVIGVARRRHLEALLFRQGLNQ